MSGYIKLHTNAIRLARSFQGDIVGADVQNIWRSIRAREVHFHLFDIVEVTIGREDGVSEAGSGAAVSVEADAVSDGIRGISVWTGASV